MEVDKTINFLLSLCPFTYPFKFLLGALVCGLKSVEDKLLKIIGQLWLLTKYQGSLADQNITQVLGLIEAMV